MILQVWHMVEQLQRLKMIQQLQMRGQNTILHVKTPLLLALEVVSGTEWTGEEGTEPVWMLWGGFAGYKENCRKG